MTKHDSSITSARVIGMKRVIVFPIYLNLRFLSVYIWRKEHDMSFACVPVISWWEDNLHVVSIELVTGEQSVAKDAPPTHSSPPGGCHRPKEKL